MSWPAKQDLLRLEGFEEPWEMCVLHGKECMEDQTLEDCGITKTNNTVTTVRKVLVAEGTYTYLYTVCGAVCVYAN